MEEIFLGEIGENWSEKGNLAEEGGSFGAAVWKSPGFRISLVLILAVGSYALLI